MKQIMETATDVAAVCFFDPEALPEDFDRLSKEAPFEILSLLAKDGRVWSKETGADGAYLFHFYIDEDAPERIRSHSQDPQRVGRFRVPSGTIWACGAEYAARNPLERLKKLYHMGESFRLQAGDYSVIAWRTDWPEDEVEQEIEKRVGKKRNRSHNLLGVTTSVLFLTTVIASFVTISKTLTALAEGTLGRGVGWAWAFVILGWIICIPLMRILTRMEKDPRRKEIEREFPSIVVQMTKLV